MQETRKICTTENGSIWATPENLPFLKNEIYQLFSYSFGPKVPKWKCAHILLCKKYKNCLKLLNIADLEHILESKEKKTPCTYNITTFDKGFCLSSDWLISFLIIKPKKQLTSNPCRHSDISVRRSSSDKEKEMNISCAATDLRPSETWWHQKPDVQCPQNIDAGPVFPYSVLFVQCHERRIRVRGFLCCRHVCLIV